MQASFINYRDKLFDTAWAISKSTQSTLLTHQLHEQQYTYP